MAQRIGIDDGCTNAKIALVGDDGKIIYSNSFPSRVEMGYHYTINSMKEAIKDLLKEQHLKKFIVSFYSIGSFVILFSKTSIFTFCFIIVSLIWVL